MTLATSGFSDFGSFQFPLDPKNTEMKIWRAVYVVGTLLGLLIVGSKIF